VLPPHGSSLETRSDMRVTTECVNDALAWQGSIDNTVFDTTEDKRQSFCLNGFAVDNCLVHRQDTNEKRHGPALHTS
jgi:hypothetical protein